MVSPPFDGFLGRGVSAEDADSELCRDESPMARENHVDQQQHCSGSRDHQREGHAEADDRDKGDDEVPTDKKPPEATAETPGTTSSAVVPVDAVAEAKQAAVAMIPISSDTNIKSDMVRQQLKLDPNFAQQYCLRFLQAPNRAGPPQAPGAHEVPPAHQGLPADETPVERAESNDSVLNGIQRMPEEEEGIMPPSLSRHGARQACNRGNQVPGAYPIQGMSHDREQGSSFSSNRGDAAVPEDDVPLIEATLVASGHFQPNTNNDEERAQVTVRTGSNNSMIPQAVIVETNTWLNRWKTASLQGRMLCLVPVAILIALAFTGIVCGSGNVCSADGDETLMEESSSTSTPVPTTPTTMPPYSLPPYTLMSIEENPDSAQARAHDWLMRHYGEESLQEMPFWRRDQLFVLACLYYSFEGITQPDILRTTADSFHASVPECTWSSVTCNEEGKVVSFHLTTSPMEVVGSMPPEIELLTSLQSFAANYLLLQGNLDDILTSKLSNLPLLQVLSLEENQITGTLPRFVVENMTQLTSLILKNNQLTGTIHPEFLSTAMTPSMSNLRVLELNRNKFKGTLPTDDPKFVGNTNLQILGINHNAQLTGTISTRLSMMAGLQTLYLDECSLTGTLPTELGLLTDLNFFRGHQNMLTGTLPTELGSLTKLFNFRFHTNPFTGTVPTEFGFLQQLTSLSMRNMNLSGTLPSELGMLTTVGHLTFARSNLSGTVPSELGLCTSLHKLGLGYGLSGTVPRSLCQLTLREEKPVEVTIDCETMDPCPSDCVCKCA
ncbi:STYKc [Seminavis robusta]|uniref:STYKc n=1 Tax=Seminavis robusta TaxID=568900 RepID=A0A9N8HKX5_9STRA|nr:STYKc [Seminavis robusta]|eukprot:Sro981_g227500.1 STYKc (780) ;mRNA; r:8898-11237